MTRISRRPETAADAAFRFALFCDARHPCESLPGLDGALATQLLRHQFAGQDASYRAAFPGARHDIVAFDGVEVGRIVVDEAREAWTLVDIALLGASRGRGLGTHLLQETIADAHAAGVPLRLRVMAWNTDAARLYARLGFVTVAVGDIDIEMVIAPRPNRPESHR